MLLLHCRTHVSSPSTNFCLVVGQSNSFPLNGNTQRFCPGEGRCKFLHKYKISSGEGGEDMEINSLVNLQVFLYLPKFFLGKTKQTRLDDGIVVCLYLVQQKPYQHMFKQKYHKNGLNFLTRNLAGGI